MEQVVVGVDLGNSFIRAYFSGKTIIMYHSLLLEKANVFINKKPTNDCLVDIPLLAGLRFDEPAFLSIARQYNYIFRKGNNRTIQLKLSHETPLQEFHCEFSLLLMLKGLFVTSPHLKYLLAHKPIKLVVTVFQGDSNHYRLALANCLTAAGITQYSMVSTPSCITVAYLKEGKQGTDEREIIGVVDFGDRGMSVTVCKVFSQEVGIVEVLQSEVSFLGGSHLTALLGEHVIGQLARDKGMDITRTPKIMHRLKVLAEEAKVTLSHNEMAFVRLDGLPDILVYGCQISSNQFEHCVKGALQKNIDLIKNTLKHYSVSKIVLNGGSSNIPAFRKMLADQLGHYKMVDCKVEWIREGLMAIKAGTIQVLEIAPFELRIEGDQKFSCVAVAKGQSIPLRKKIPMKFPSGELTYSMRFFQNGLLIASCLIPERPSETRYNLYVEVDHNKMLNIYATNSKGLIKMTINMMDIPKEQYLSYASLLTQLDFHNEND